MSMEIQSGQFSDADVDIECCKSAVFLTICCLFLKRYGYPNLFIKLLHN